MKKNYSKKLLLKDILPFHKDNLKMNQNDITPDRNSKNLMLL